MPTSGYVVVEQKRKLDVGSGKYMVVELLNCLDFEIGEELRKAELLNYQAKQQRRFNIKVIAREKGDTE